MALNSMENSFRGKRRSLSVQGRFVPSFVFLLLCAYSGLSLGADVDVLLELAKIRIPPALSDWNVSNIANMCSWSGIRCNNQGRVNDINLSVVSKATATIGGELPSSLSNLTFLRGFSVDNNRLIGTFPPGVWSLLELENVALTNTALDVTMPQTVSPVLRAISVDDTKLSGSIPELPWTNVTVLDFAETDLSCPLPQGLVNFFNSLNEAPRNLNCRLSRTRLYVDDENMLCGQLHISKVWCEIYPLQETPPDFGRNSSALGTPIIAVNYTGVTAEVYKRDIFLFASYMDNGVRKIHRDEFFGVRFYPLSAQPFFDASYINRTNFAFSGVQSASLVSPTVLVINMTAGPNRVFNVDYIFEFKSAPSQSFQPLTVKFSVRIQNNGWTWPPSAKPQIFVLPATFTYRVAHSPQGGPAPRCSAPDPLFQQCQSPLTTVTLQLQSGDQILFDTSVKSTNIELSYLYGTTVKIDGFVADNLGVTVSRRFSGVGLTNRIRDYAFLNQSQRLDASVGDPRTQFFSLLSFGAAPSFQREFLYDPDISILFSPPISPASPPDIAQLSSEANTVAVIVGVVVAVAVVVAGVTVFAKFVFPYMQLRMQRKAQASNLMEPIEVASELQENSGNSAPDRSKRWTTAVPRNSLST